MDRADKARTNEEIEIPIARRVNAFELGSRTKRNIVILVSCLLTTLLISIAQNIQTQTRLKLLIVSAFNKENRLLGHYSYPEASMDDLVYFRPGIQVHKDIIESLNQMKNAAAEEGIDLIILSGFRSIKLQNEIFYNNKSLRNQIAIERARVSAPPGYSEHATGFAIDIGEKDSPATDFEISFASTETFRWLKKNAARYHFILSFPESNVQGISYEPWHWRFEGSVDALREFETTNQMRRSQ